MPQRITVEHGKIGAYFYDNRTQRILSFEEVASILNSSDWSLTVDEGEEDV